MPAYPGCPGKKAVKRVFCVQGCWVALWANNVFCCKCKKWFSDRDTCRTIDSSVHFWTWQLVFESKGKTDSWTWIESNQNIFHWIVQHYQSTKTITKEVNSCLVVFLTPRSHIHKWPLFIPLPYLFEDIHSACNGQYSASGFHTLTYKF